MEELKRRQQAGYTFDTSTTSIYERYPTKPFHLTSDDLQELATRLHVNESILQLNIKRLRSICYYFLELYELYERKIQSTDRFKSNQYSLNSKQMSLVLEYFLQIDGMYSNFNSSF